MIGDYTILKKEMKQHIKNNDWVSKSGKKWYKYDRITLNRGIYLYPYYFNKGVWKLDESEIYISMKIKKKMI